MTEQQRTNGESNKNLRESAPVSESTVFQPADYLEETSAEFAMPATYNQRAAANRSEQSQSGETAKSGKGIGIAALILSILSLFVSPILFGIVGIVLGFVARKRGSTSLGSWAIGIGAVSIIVGMFIQPFI